MKLVIIIIINGLWIYVKNLVDVFIGYVWIYIIFFECIKCILFLDW